MRILIGLCLMLGSLLAVNALATLFIEFAWRKRGNNCRVSAHERASLLFALRTLPVFCAFAWVLGIVLPAFVIYEPVDANETVNWALGLAAAASSFGFSRAVYGGLRRQLSTRRLLNNWLQQSEPMSIDGWSLPAFRLRHQHPVVALVGILRPRLFIAGCVLRSLSSNELAAVIAHERAHLEAHHNLKRFVLMMCSDLLGWIPFGRDLEREWMEASESAADEVAARQGPETSLQLALALIRTARIAPPDVQLAVPVSVSLATDRDIEGRVQRLLELAGDDVAASRSGFGVIVLYSFLFCAPLAGAIWFAADPERLRQVHELIEIMVNTAL